MKKLMIAAAIICAAAVTQAATVSWKSGTMKIPASGTEVKDSPAAQSASGLSKINGYLWITGTTADDDGGAAGLALMNSVLADLASDYGAAANKLYSGKYEGLTLANADVGPSKTSMGAVTLSSTGEDQTLYGVVLFTYENGDDVWLMANGAAVTVAKSANSATNLGLNLYNEGGTTKGSTTMKWYAAQDVPEPTSAMLLLLGVAGLALRRRRA